MQVSFYHLQLIIAINSIIRIIFNFLIMQSREIYCFYCIFFLDFPLIGSLGSQILIKMRIILFSRVNLGAILLFQVNYSYLQINL